MVEDRNTTARRVPASAADTAELVLDGTGDARGVTAAIEALCGRVEEQKALALIRVQGGLAGPAGPGATTVQDVNRFERALRRLERLPALIVCTAGGACGGAALDLLLASDHRIAAPDLRLSLPVSDGQFWPGMGLYRLAHQLGVARARQLVLWGGTLDAGAAMQTGLVDEISDDMQAAVERTVALLGGGGGEFAVRRRLLLEAPAVPFEDALGAHLAACDRELRRLRAPP